VVYQAKWRGSIVAVKQLKRGFNDRTRQDFLEECQFMRNLQPHPNVVTFLGISENPVCMVTEFCKNGSLKSHLDDFKKPIPNQLQLKIISDVAAGMYHLENEKIIHRDLAARNCLLTENFVTKVADFGLSKIAGEPFDQTSEYGHWPLKWLSPETLKSRIFNEKTDVWSFGILIIEVLTRRDPYPDYTVDDFALKCNDGNLATNVRNQIPIPTPKLLKDIAYRCLEMEPEKRPSFASICIQLEN